MSTTTIVVAISQSDFSSSLYFCLLFGAFFGLIFYFLDFFINDK